MRRVYFMVLKANISPASPGLNKVVTVRELSQV